MIKEGDHGLPDLSMKPCLSYGKSRPFLVWLGTYGAIIHAQLVPSSPQFV